MALEGQVRRPPDRRPDRRTLERLVRTGKHPAADAWSTPASCSRPTPTAPTPGPTSASPRPWRSAA